MHNFKPYIRLIIFIAGFILLNKFLTFCIVPAEQCSRIVLHEATEVLNSHDLVVFGASEAHADWDSNKADEILGITTFNMGGTAAKLNGGIYAQFQNYMEYQDPSTVVFIIGRNDLGSDAEVPAVYVHLAPYMRDRWVAMKYYFRTIFSDAFYKTFPWNAHHVYDWKELKENIQRKLSTEYLEYHSEWIPVDDFEYKGKGFYAYQGTLHCDNVEGLSSFSDLTDSFSVGKHAAMLKKMVKQCKEDNRKVIILIAPTPDMEIASLSFYPYYSEWLKKFAEENGALYYDMNYAVEELWDRQSDQFSDVAHLNGQGAEKFTEAVCKLIQMQKEGKNTDELFYNWEEYVDSIDYVTATYLKVYEGEEKAKFVKAYSIMGTKATPEYSFVLRNISDGSETILQDFDDNDTIKLPDEMMNDQYSLRVYARAKNENDPDNIRYYDYPLP